MGSPGVSRLTCILFFAVLAATERAKGRRKESLPFEFYFLAFFFVSNFSGELLHLFFEQCSDLLPPLSLF